jgi:hypothetical protein
MTVGVKTFDIEISEDVDKNLFNEILYKSINFLKHTQYFSSNYLLDTNKLINVHDASSTHIIEKLVYDIAKTHCVESNIKIEDVFIEFWFKAEENNTDKNRKHELHLDCDEYDRIANDNKNFNVPLVSSVTYLSDNYTFPTVITDVDREKINTTNTLIFSFPKKYRSISFNGGECYHGKCCMLKNHFIDNDLRQILAINLWLKKPNSMSYFDVKQLEYTYAMKYKEKLKNIEFYKNQTLFSLVKNDNCVKTICDNSNENIIETVFNEGGSNCDTFLYYEKVIRQHLTDNSVFIFKKSTNNLCEDAINSNNQIVAMDNKDIINNLKLIDLNEEKFKQRFIFNKALTKDICQWIIFESETYANNNSGWMSSRHELYATTDLPLENINNVYKFVIKSFFNNTIRRKFIDSYCMNENSVFDVIDAFIVKYETGLQVSLDMHKDVSSCSACLLLNENKEFEGGGTFYEDNITVKLDMGDMVIHTKNHRHSGLQITKGLRYLLVFFINVYEKPNDSL